MIFDLIRRAGVRSLPVLGLHVLNKCLAKATGKTLAQSVMLRLPSGRVGLTPGGQDGLGFWLEVERSGIYDSLEAPLRAGHCLIDCGANTGAVCVRYLNRIPGAKAVALEPHPETFKKLCRNLRANELTSRITALNQAAGEADGTVEFTVSEHSSMGFVAGDGIDVAQGKRTTIPVPVTSLNSVVESMPALAGPLALKIDVEGYELQVLRGATRLFHRTSHIVLEAHSQPLIEACSALLTGHGFAVRGREAMVYADNPHCLRTGTQNP